MNVAIQIARHLREVHYGGNWTASNLSDQLDVTWHEAATHVGSFHSIAEIVYHMNFFVDATLKVLREGLLDAPEHLSFDCPPVESQADWELLMQKVFADVDQLAAKIEQLPESRLWQHFVNAKWGSYYRCLHGPIEHCHYHLGQIAMIKTMLRHAEEPPQES